ncbi:MAG: ABC transporter ATP-binding protein, partial [Planctomycetota bacterium]
EWIGQGERAWRGLRGRRIAMVFQDPMTSLNPYLRVEVQLVEVAEHHLGLGRRAARLRAVEALERVGIPEAARRIRAWPHEFSGGMRQRVMIAMALLGEPDLLLADEATTALDVTIQAQILDLLESLRRERGLAILLVTHDLGVVARLCDRVLVMYAGRILEAADTDDLFSRPAHPYTRALLRSVGRLDEETPRELESIGGMPPRLDRGPFEACTFAPRCAWTQPRCLEGEPPLEPWAPRRLRRCRRRVEDVT